MVEDRPIKIMLAVPSIGYVFSEAVHSLMEFSFDCGKMEASGKYTFILAMIPRMLVQQARETAATQALELGCDYLFMVDDDMVLPRNLLERLLSHDKDVVGVVAFERRGDHNPNIYVMTSMEEDDKGRGVIGTFKYSNIISFHEDADDNGLVEADAIGFGCVLISRKVLEAIEPPYFLCQFNLGEDIFFCWQAKEKGFEVFMDCEWALGHVADPTIITEDAFRKRLKEKDEVIEQNRLGIAALARSERARTVLAKARGQNRNDIAMRAINVLRRADENSRHPDPNLQPA